MFIIKVFCILLLILGISRGKSFAFRSLKCWNIYFQKDFHINRCINFDIKYSNFINTVKYNCVMSPVSEQDRLAV